MQDCSVCGRRHRRKHQITGVAFATGTSTASGRVARGARSSRSRRKRSPIITRSPNTFVASETYRSGTWHRVLPKCRSCPRIVVATVFCHALRVPELRSRRGARGKWPQKHLCDLPRRWLRRGFPARAALVRTIAGHACSQSPNAIRVAEPSAKNLRVGAHRLRRPHSRQTCRSRASRARCFLRHSAAPVGCSCRATDRRTRPSVNFCIEQGTSPKHPTNKPTCAAEQAAAPDGAPLPCPGLKPLLCRKTHGVTPPADASTSNAAGGVPLCRTHAGPRRS